MISSIVSRGLRLGNTTTAWAHGRQNTYSAAARGCCDPPVAQNLPAVEDSADAEWLLQGRSCSAAVPQPRTWVFLLQRSVLLAGVTAVTRSLCCDYSCRHRRALPGSAHAARAARYRALLAGETPPTPVTPRGRRPHPRAPSRTRPYLPG